MIYRIPAASLLHIILCTCPRLSRSPWVVTWEQHLFVSKNYTCPGRDWADQPLARKQHGAGRERNYQPGPKEIASGELHHGSRIDIDMVLTRWDDQYDQVLFLNTRLLTSVGRRHLPWRLLWTSWTDQPRGNSSGMMERPLVGFVRVKS